MGIIYDRDIKPKLKEKDGLVHVLMVSNYSRLRIEIFVCEDGYTTQIDEIVTGIQKDGYEIIDIKFNSILDDGVRKHFDTLITYK